MSQTPSLCASVESALQCYFDGLYECDLETLREVFHPRAIYACATGDKLTYLTMDEYFPIVGSRIPPAAKGEVRRDAIEAISFAGTKTAAARVRCAIGEKHFTDFLSLIFEDGRWQIISKVFHYDLLEPQRS